MTGRTEMENINSVTISGNLTRDPEMRQTASGMQIMSFGVAVNDRRKNQQGEWEDYANFIDVTMFGNRAQSLSNMLTKGMKVCIHGKLRYSSWDDRNGGGKRSKIEVVADGIDLMAQRGNAQSPASAQNVDAPATCLDDDCPF